MFASFEYDLSKEDYLRGIKAISRSLSNQHPKMGRRYVLQIALLGVALVLASLLDPGTTNLVFSVYVLTLAVACFIQSRFAEHWRALTFDVTQSHIALSIDDSGLIVKQSDVERRYAWNALRCVQTLPDVVVLQMADWHAITMPGKLWPNSEARADFISQLRDRAPGLALDLPLVTEPSTQFLLPLLGAVALALNLMIAADPAMQLFGIDFRASAAGQLLTIVPFVIYGAAAAAAWMALLRLHRNYPRLANFLAIASIALFVALQGIPPALQIYRFFTPPAP